MLLKLRENRMDQSEQPSRPWPAGRGRPFQKGNGGRKPGSKNRTSAIAAALLDDEVTNLVRKAVDLALAGDVTMLKFLLGRILPRERMIKLDLPHMDFADDAVEALSLITRAVSEGAISPSEGASVATIVNSCAAAIDIADVVKRLDVLEARYKGELVG
jgi:hypothetical protein